MCCLWYCWLFSLSKAGFDMSIAGGITSHRTLTEFSAEKVVSPCEVHLELDGLVHGCQTADIWFCPSKIVLSIWRNLQIFKMDLDSLGTLPLLLQNLKDSRLALMHQGFALAIGILKKKGKALQWIVYTISME